MEETKKCTEYRYNNTLNLREPVIFLTTSVSDPNYRHGKPFRIRLDYFGINFFFTDKFISEPNLFISEVSTTFYRLGTGRRCGGSGSVESVSFQWIRIRIKKWLDPESGSVSNDTDPDPTKTIENIN